MKTYTITVNGNVHNVTVEDDRQAAHLQAAPVAPKAAYSAAAPKEKPAASAGSVLTAGANG